MNLRSRTALAARFYFLHALGVLLLCASVIWPASAQASESASFTQLNALPLPAASDKRLHAALAGLRGQPVIVNFWATWCPPCRDEMPALWDLAEYLQADGLRVITVLVADKRARAADFLRPYGIDLPLIDDPEQELSRAWGARVLPTSLLLDRRHRLRWRATGAVDWLAPETEKFIQSLF